MQFDDYCVWRSSTALPPYSPNSRTAEENIAYLRIEAA